MSDTSHVKGLSDCMAAFDDLPKAVQRPVLIRLGKEALEPMAETARKLAPDDPATGPPDLHTSIIVGTQQKSSTKVFRDPDKEFGATIYMGPTKHGYPQAIPQEFGSVKMAPHPFMRPAFQQHVQGVFDYISANLARLILAAAKRWEKRAARLAAKRP